MNLYFSLEAGEVVLKDTKGFILVEALLVFAGCVLIVVLILTSIDVTSHLQKEINKIDHLIIDEKLKDAY